MAHVDTAAVARYLGGLRDRLIAELQRLDGNPFRDDAWRREGASTAQSAGSSGGLGGGGSIHIIEDGQLFERGGVAFSQVKGSKLPPSATAARPELAGRGFEAMGVSLVMHPRNPYVPTVHMNVRSFIALAPDGEA